VNNELVEQIQQKINTRTISDCTAKLLSHFLQLFEKTYFSASICFSSKSRPHLRSLVWRWHKSGHATTSLCTKKSHTNDHGSNNSSRADPDAGVGNYCYCEGNGKWNLLRELSLRMYSDDQRQSLWHFADLCLGIL